MGVILWGKIALVGPGLSVVIGMLFGLVIAVDPSLPLPPGPIGLVGGALGANRLVFVTLGVMLPHVLKRLKMNPTLVSSPLLTTVTDMCGFFVLSFATAVLSKLEGM